MKIEVEGVVMNLVVNRVSIGMDLIGNGLRYSIHMKPQGREEFNSFLGSKLIRDGFGDGDHLDLLIVH